MSEGGGQAVEREGGCGSLDRRIQAPKETGENNETMNTLENEHFKKIKIEI